MLRDRFGGGDEARQASLSGLEPIRHRILDNADFKHGDTVLDVGCGDGFIGLGALSRVGPTGRVIFTDISQKLLDHCAQTIADLGAGDRSELIQTNAESLAGIANESVDVVTTRSVLIYVDDKVAAFASFYRVLRTGGRISLFEPINRRTNDLNKGSLLGFELPGLEEIVGKLWQAFDRYGPKSMTEFDENDLFRLAENADFEHLALSLELKSEVVLLNAMDCSSFMNTSPNPLAPSLAEIIDEVLTPAEAERFEARITQIGADGGRTRNRVAYAFLKATKM